MNNNKKILGKVIYVITLLFLLVILYLHMSIIKATILMILYVARKTYIHQNLKEIKKQNIHKKVVIKYLLMNLMMQCFIKKCK